MVEVLHAPQTSLGWFDGRAVLDRRSHTLPLIDLRRWLGVPAEQPPLLTVVLQAAKPASAWWWTRCAAARTW